MDYPCSLGGCDAHVTLVHNVIHSILHLSETYLICRVRYRFKRRVNQESDSVMKDDVVVRSFGSCSTDFNSLPLFSSRLAYRMIHSFDSSIESDATDH